MSIQQKIEKLKKEGERRINMRLDKLLGKGKGKKKAVVEQKIEIEQKKVKVPKTKKVKTITKVDVKTKTNKQPKKAKVEKKIKRKRIARKPRSLPSALKKWGDAVKVVRKAGHKGRLNKGTSLYNLVKKEYEKNK